MMAEIVNERTPKRMLVGSIYVDAVDGWIRDRDLASDDDDEMW